MIRPPPKKKRGLCGAALQRYPTNSEYSIVAILAKVFEQPSWFFEQWRGRLLDCFENERGR